jgi:ATP-dependent Clp protease protease subunit
MSKRKLPAAEIAARPGLRTEILPAALGRWNPDVRAAADGESDNTISILDVIGADWFGEGVTAKRIAGALRAIGERDVTVNVNSPGGDYFEGLAIYNMLREHKGKVTVKVLGLAASAASVIAMAGDEVRIARAGFFMIHNTWVIAMGDRNALREVADWLEPFDRAAADIYAARTGLKESEIAKMLDRETWIPGSQAVEDGFADELLASDEVASGASNSAAARPRESVMREIEHLLARAGVPSARRRELVLEMKGGMRDAASTGMRDAAVVAEVEGLLHSIRSI